jgi:hypothetical protein
MARLYKVYNFPMPTTAAPGKVATGTAIKTLLQLAPPSTFDVTVAEWGISFDASAAGVPIQCELIETDVAATVTAHVASGLVAFNREALAMASQVSLGTALTGYTASAEGTITSTRELDAQLIAPTNQNWIQWPLQRDTVIRQSKFGRIRVTAPVTVNAWCYIAYEE